jgi:two-component system NtrC family sensor kinase
MQGTEFCRVMRAHIATATIPLLILTGDTSGEQHGLESGADDYVAKSSDRDVLLARIELLLRRATALTKDGSRDYFRARQILAVDDSPTYLALIEDELRRRLWRHRGTGWRRRAQCDCGPGDRLRGG